MKPVELIVARATNGAIGFQGGMPWHIPSDLGYFKEKTMGRVMIMGRKTFVSMGRVLPGRTSIVVTRLLGEDWNTLTASVPNPKSERVLCAQSLEGALELAWNTNPSLKPVIVGGGEIYRLALEKNFVDKMWITQIQAKFPNADTYFVIPDDKRWQMTWESQIHSCPVADATNGQASFRFTWQGWEVKKETNCGTLGL
jgi:dihydrofolate reductase